MRTWPANTPRGTDAHDEELPHVRQSLLVEGPASGEVLLPSLHPAGNQPGTGDTGEGVQQPVVFADQLVACRGVGFDFYPEDGERAQEAAVRLRPLAWSYCRRCPVRAACEAEGAQGEQGLWGGVLYWPGRRTPVDLLAPVLAGVS
jgi:hypothetical protein